MLPCFSEPSTQSIPIIPLAKGALEEWLDAQPERVKAWAESSGFKANRFETLRLPGEAGGLAALVLGLGQDGLSGSDPWLWGGLPKSLPAGVYHIDGDLDEKCANDAALGWALGSYRFDRYKQQNNGDTHLVVPDTADQGYVEATAEAIWLTRDLVNTPANDMGPAELAEAAEALAAEFGASFKVIVGEDLLSHNFPAVYEVGKGSERLPRLIDFTWGDDSAPKVTLVGKGVVFDTGGYDLKPSRFMRLMKKDMGGAANVLGLARMIMALKLPVRLRVLIPAVENSVSGNAFRPGDVIASRKGLSIEIGNTDAEGRLVLADALALACEEKPEMLLDFATLTGAARSALGPEVPPLFTDDDQLATDILSASETVHDPVWRLPLWMAYAQELESPIADMKNDGGPFAGAITAALFLKRFVENGTSWAHFDIYAWNPKTRPGRPEGGEAMGIRTIFEVLNNRYGNKTV